MLGVISITVECVPRRSLRGGSYGHKANYKLKLKRKTIVGIDAPYSNHLLDLPHEMNLTKEKENHCLVYAICSALVLKNHNNEKKPLLLEELCTETEKFIDNNTSLIGMKFPSSVKDVQTFVKANKHLKLRVNVLTYINEQIYPLKLNICSNKANDTDHNVVNLLLACITRKTESFLVPDDVDDDDKKDEEGGPSFSRSNVEWGESGHFFLITDVDLFLRKHYYVLDSDAKKKSYYQKSFWCLKCFTPFSTSSKYSNHKISCINDSCQIELLPRKPTELELEENKTKLFKKGNYLQFDKFYAKFPLHYMLYYDFEVVLAPIPDHMQENRDDRDDELYSVPCLRCRDDFSTTGRCKCGDASISMSTNKHIHIPIMYSFIVVDRFGRLILEESRVCPHGDGGEKFVDSLLQKEEYLRTLVEHQEDLVSLTPEEEDDFESAENCIICGEQFNLETDRKVMDHCHFTGHYLGAAHNSCNMLRERRKILNCVAHNGVSSSKTK